MTGYLDDLQIGQRFMSGTHVVDEESGCQPNRPQSIYLSEVVKYGEFY